MEGKPRDQRPCDNCRRRKIRCLFATNEAVNCVLCISRSTECTYIQEPTRKKRNLSNVGERVQDAGGSRVKQRQRVTKQDTIYPVLQDYSSIPGQSLLKETLGHQNRQSSSVIGAATDFDPSIIRNVPFDAKGECLVIKAPPILRRANPHIYFRMRPDTSEEMERELANLDAIEEIVKPYGPELVKLYFRIVHPSFPILHKKVFLEKYSRTYRESTPIGLGAVYVLALNWWSYSSSLSNLPKPDAKELERLVLKSLFEVSSRPKISDLQGGLVLLQRLEVSSWTLTGHLLAMSQNLGINLDSSDWAVPDWERGVRKRVAWAMYMQDKWGALVYGRPSNIRNEDWEVNPLEVSDFPETSQDDDDEEGSAEIEKGRQTFVKMVELTKFVAEILEQFYTLKALRSEQDIHEVLEKARPIQTRLKDWHENLPSALSIEDTSPRRLSSVGYLHLAYYTAEISLHRAILRTYPYHPSSSLVAIPFLTYPVSSKDIYSSSRIAASDLFSHSLSFVSSLKPEHLQSFWYFSSSLSLAIIGIFASILCSNSLSQPERGEYVAKLAEYRWKLRISSTGAEFMKYAVGVLDGVSTLLEEQGKKMTDGSKVVDAEKDPSSVGVPSDEFSPIFADSVPSITSPGNGTGDIDWNQQPLDLDLSSFGTFSMDGAFAFENTEE